MLDKTFQPVASPEVTARIALPDQEPREEVLRAVPNQAGMFTGQYLAAATGDYTITVKGEEAEGKAGFQVQKPQLEFEHPAMDDQTLGSVAAASGGRYFDLSDLDGLPEAMAASRPPVTVPDESPLWDRWGMLIAVVVLLSVELLIRKRSDLA